MQHVSSGVLQELQQQGESQAEAGGHEFGAAPVRGGGGISLSSAETSSTSFPFSSENRTHSSPPSTPPFFVSSTTPPRESPPPVSGGRRRSGAGSVSAETVTIQRPGSGPEASSPTSWHSATEAVPSQLLGQRAGTNADFLIQTPDAVDKYKSNRLASTTAHLRSLVANLPTPLPLAMSHVTQPLQSPPSTPRSGHSNNSISSFSSIDDESSDASSFAFGLRRSKPDLRLLKKKSKPSQHLIQKPSILKISSDGRRSPSFYKPKVIEDTGVVESTTKDIRPPHSPERLIPLTLPELLRTEPDIKPVRKVQTLKLPDKRPGFLRNSSKESKSRPNLQRCSSAREIKLGTQQRQLRFESPQILNTTSHEPLRPSNPVSPTTSGKPIRLSTPRKASVVLHQQDTHKRHYHNVTPPEDEPSADASPFRHGDSYFHTFGADTVYNKEFVPARSPLSLEERNRKTNQRGSGFYPTHQRLSATDTPSAQQLDIAEAPPKLKKRMSSTLFSLFRMTAFKDVNVFELPSKRRARMPSSPARKVPQVTPTATPGIVVCSPVDSNDTQRQMSMVPELTVPSYFARPKAARGDSQYTITPLSPALSPGAVPATPEEAVRSPSEPAHHQRTHNRSSSEALSPLGTPRIRQRKVRESTLEDSKEDEDEGSALLSLPTPIKGSPLPSASSRSGRSNEDGSYGYTKSVTVSPVPSRSSPDLRQVGAVSAQNQEFPLKKKDSFLKGLYLDLRHFSSPDTVVREEPREISTGADARKPALSLRASFSRVNLRPSLSTINVRNGKLVKKSVIRGWPREQLGSDEEFQRDSQGSNDLPEKAARRITAADLEVTEFFQTPFSKRYYDTKRATQQAIRAFVDDTLEEDDQEDDDEVVLGFENDVPDHLPNSPLCPLHPKHKSGGKAICPLHGRYKKSRARAAEYATKSAHKVEIVFDTREFSELSAKARTASMGSDGAGPALPEPIPIRKQVSWKKSKSRDSEPRGRKREKGECAAELRRRRHGKRRLR